MNISTCNLKLQLDNKIPYDHLLYAYITNISTCDLANLELQVDNKTSCDHLLYAFITNIKYHSVWNGVSGLQITSIYFKNKRMLFGDNKHMRNPEIEKYSDSLKDVHKNSFFISLLFQDSLASISKNKLNYYNNPNCLIRYELKALLYISREYDIGFVWYIFCLCSYL